MVLLVIDMQKALMVDELYSFDSLLTKISKLIKIARKNEIEVIYFQHDAGKGTGFSLGDIGFEIADEVAPIKNEKVFIKTINSCFGNNDFSKYLENIKEKELMIVGLQTDYCIDATIKSAFEKGYKVYVPQGTNSTFDNSYMDKETTYKYYNKWIWPGTFAECISFNEAIKMLEKK